MRTVFFLEAPLVIEVKALVEPAISMEDLFEGVYSQRFAEASATVAYTIALSERIGQRANAK